MRQVHMRCTVHSTAFVSCLVQTIGGKPVTVSRLENNNKQKEKKYRENVRKRLVEVWPFCRCHIGRRQEIYIEWKTLWPPSLTHPNECTFLLRDNYVCDRARVCLCQCAREWMSEWVLSMRCFLRLRQWHVCVCVCWWLLVVLLRLMENLNFA